MYPDDRVLVGVINRKRDLKAAREERWYRIPQSRMQRGVDTEYVAFFLSRAFGDENGGIHYYAAKAGLELRYRRDLLPKEADHPRADDVYYRVALGEIKRKVPPVLNPTNRTITFIYTTWDRFVEAAQISDLYSKADIFVDRIFYALREHGYQPQRTWDAQRRETGVAAELRVLCERGSVIVSSERAHEGTIFLDPALADDAILTRIRAEIAAKGGAASADIPLEGE